jgi:hypothetical protein
MEREAVLYVMALVRGYFDRWSLLDENSLKIADCFARPAINPPVCQLKAVKWSNVRSTSADP